MLSQQLHDLDAGFAVQGASGFVCQQNVRIVDEGPGDGHPLHLSAGHLVGLLVEMVSQADLFQGVDSALPALFLRYARQG